MAVDQSSLDKFRNDIPLSKITDPAEGPQLKTVPLDASTQEALGRGMENASQSPEDIQAKLNQNLDQTGNLSQGDQQISQEAQRMNIPPGQLEAIRNVYNREANSGIEQIKNQNLQKAQMMKGDYLNTMAKTMMAQHQQAANQYSVLTQAYQQQEAARAGAINSIFQVGDTAIGAQSAKSNSRTLDSGKDKTIQDSNRVGGSEVSDYTNLPDAPTERVGR